MDVESDTPGTDVPREPDPAPDPDEDANRRIMRHRRLGGLAARLPLRSRRTRKADPGRPARHRKRRRRLIALCLVLVILGGLGTVAGSLFFDSVDLPEDLDAALNQNSTVYFSDGKTPMARIGTETRTSVSLDQIPEHVQWALIAAEDQDFYEHDGVDFWGVTRALWNNVTGGGTQGASTLTQQYVGQAADIRGDDSYLRKAREAVMAMKMDDEYSKEDILTHYLNLVYFGRGAYGIQAASQAFFGENVGDIDVSEAALLIAQIKSPDGSMDPRDPLEIGPSQTRAAATARWNYVLDQMVSIGKLDAGDRAELTELPVTIDPDTQIDAGADTPTGFVSHKYVLQELHAAGLDADAVRRGGYRITTTVDATLEDAVVGNDDLAAVAEDDDNDAGLVAIDPASGGVVAYYGGENGAGMDVAGPDAPHPPGTSANIVPVLAAMEAGSSLDSRWDGSSPRTFPSRLDNGEDEELLNVGGANDPNVTLGEALAEKLDTPMYAVANEFGPPGLGYAAGELGITDATLPDGTDVTLPDDSDRITQEFALGTYSIPVLESAQMYATLAAEGVRYQPHFVAEVTDPAGDVVYRPDPVEAIGTDAGFAAGITHALTEPPSVNPDDLTEIDKRPIATNASSTWYCGYIPQLATSVWAGDDAHEGDGSSPDDTIAQAIWESFMSEALTQYPEVIPFSDPPPVGNDSLGEL